MRRRPFGTLSLLGTPLRTPLGWTLTGFLVFAASPLVAAEWAFLDLKPYATSEIVKKEWWTGNPGDSTLSRLPMDKEAEFNGPDGSKVKFLVKSGVIVLKGTNAPNWAPEVKGIKVEGKAKTVYFLHATGWEFPGGPSYKFVLNYADKTQAELPMTSNQNSDDWCHDDAPLPDKNSVWGWVLKEGPPCNHAGLITTRWQHPKSDQQIATMDILSMNTAAVPIIAAISLGEATLDVEPGGSLVVMWGRLKQ